MRAWLPASTFLFAVTAGLFALQAFPFTGVFLMMLGAPLWSVLLINAGMIGTAAEAATGRVSRVWLILPLAFYGGYWTLAAQDHLRLNALSAAYDAANAGVDIPFDPARQSLAFVEEGSGGWFTRNYALPVAYSVNGNFPEGYLSHRIMDAATCAKVRETPALSAAFVKTSWFHDGDSIRSRRLEKRFCSLSMPERPERPLVQVSRREERTVDGSLPVTRVTTTVTMPDRTSFRLMGGVAAPLAWLPMPVVGCALNSAAPSWDCGAQFRRDRFTPIVSGRTRYERDSAVLARALGLRPVPASDRKGGDPRIVLSRMSTVEHTTLERQLENIDAMIADPLAKVRDWQVGVVASRADALASRAGAIMTGLERAASFEGKDFYRARESGRILARLLAQVSRDAFAGFGPRILALYARANDKHWLWEVGPLLSRLGEVGPGALPVLVRAPRSSRLAAAEGLCRVGSAGRSASEPVLLAMWTNARGNGSDRDLREVLFVAMRRAGVSPPPLSEDEHGRLGRLSAEWADISPRSPSRVCAVSAERSARRREKAGASRRTGPN